MEKLNTYQYKDICFDVIRVNGGAASTAINSLKEAMLLCITESRTVELRVNDMKFKLEPDLIWNTIEGLDQLEIKPN